MFFGPYAHYPEFWDVVDEEEAVDEEDIGDDDTG